MIMDNYLTVCVLTMLRNFCLQYAGITSTPNVINPSDFVEGLKGIIIIINIELQLSHAFPEFQISFQDGVATSNMTVTSASIVSSLP